MWALIESFADRTATQEDVLLETPWAWGSYTDEGLRFGFLRILEELEALHARLVVRSASPGETGSLLNAYDLAYREMQAVLWGIDDADAEKPPGKDGWDVRTTRAHILGGDLGFYGSILFALEQHRSGNWQEDSQPAEEDWDRLLGLSEEAYKTLMENPLSELNAAHTIWHERVLDTFRTVTEDELELPSRYWEEELLPIRFRLGRLASHTRQHTIQIEKTLAATGFATTETKRFLRLMFRIGSSIERLPIKSNPDDLAPLLEIVSSVLAAIESQGNP